MIWLVLVLAVVVLIVVLMKRKESEKRDFFESKGIKANKPRFFLITMCKLLLGQMGILDMIQGLYYEHSSDEKFVGFWDGNTPILMLKDPDIVKRFAVKEHEHFQDRRDFLTEEIDPLFGNSLFVLKEQKWRDMRATLSPAFTGSKMRAMLDLMAEVGEHMVSYLHKEAKEKGPQTYEMRELCSRASNDVIATCAFGVKVDSFINKKNEVFCAAKELSNFNSASVIIKFIVFRFAPKLLSFFKINLTSIKDSNFIRSLITDAMKIREEKKIVRPDMIHLLMEARKGKLSYSEAEKDTAGFATVEESSVGWKKVNRDWSETEIVAQCFLFLIGGFDSVSANLSFTTYELAANPDVQQKLYEEVKKVHDQLNGQRLTYETLQKMKYLDMVVSEGLRLYPPTTIIERECNKNVTLDVKENFPFDFKKGYGIWIPIFCFHYDENLYPNPEKFDPERFNDDNKTSINASAYIPFGIGPRNCIASRFALMELKTVLYFLILNFNLEVTSKTQVPLKFGKSFGTLQAEKGIYVQLRPRE
ncbi:hypothetical protein DMENIID0001_122260 [Sergentomyia squamirostris]